MREWINECIRQGWEDRGREGFVYSNLFPSFGMESCGFCVIVPSLMWYGLERKYSCFHWWQEKRLGNQVCGVLQGGWLSPICLWRILYSAPENNFSDATDTNTIPSLKASATAQPLLQQDLKQQVLQLLQQGLYLAALHFILLSVHITYF